MLVIIYITDILLSFAQPVIRLYAVPFTAFTAEEEEEDMGFDGEDPESAA